jgi:hypothetical protein
MKKNVKFTSVMKLFALAVLLSFTLTSCVGYYYADGIYNDPVPERPRYVEREMPPQRYDYPPENRYVDNGYNSYFRDKAKQYENPTVDSSFTHFTDVNSYRSNTYASGTSSYGGWGSNPSQVNVNIYNRSWANPYYGYYGHPYYRPYRSGWSVSLGWGWSSYYDPYWDNYYYGGYYPYYGYNPYYGYDPYYGYNSFYGYGYYPYAYGYYPYGYYYDYYRPRDYYYEPNYSYGNSRGRAIIREDGRRGDPNRYSDYDRGSYNRSQTQGSYNHRYGNETNRPSYQNQTPSYNNTPSGYELRRTYESNNSNYSGRSSNYGNSNSSGNYNSSNSSNNGGGYRSSNRD